MIITSDIKIADVEFRSSEAADKEAFMQWLKENTEPTYRDTVMSEHLYSTCLLDDWESEEDLPEPVNKCLTLILHECAQLDASYFRIITV